MKSKLSGLLAENQKDGLANLIDKSRKSRTNSVIGETNRQKSVKAVTRNR